MSKPEPTHRIVFRLIDGETTEQIVNADLVARRVSDRDYSTAATRLRDQIARKLDDGRGRFEYTLTTDYGGMHMVPVRHVLWVKVMAVEPESGERE